MLNIRSLSLLGVMLAIGASASAQEFADEDIRYRDIRLQVGPAPVQAGVASRRQGGSGTTDATVSWQSTGQWSLQWAPPVGHATSGGQGFCLLELTSLRLLSEETAQGGQLAERALIGNLHLGVGWVVADQVILEAGAYGGLGAAWQEGQDTRCQAWDVGLRLGLCWSPTQVWGGRPLVGVAVLAEYGQLSNQAEFGQAAYDLEITTRGIVPAVFVGWRF